MNELTILKKMSLVIIAILSALWLLVPVRAAQADSVRNLVHHDIRGTISPAGQSIQVRDSITVPAGFSRQFTFMLHGGLNAVTDTPGVVVRKERRENGIESYKVALPPGTSTFSVNYGGVIYHPIEPVGKETARGFSDTSGIISEGGVYLSGGSFWYPVIGDGFITFSLQIEMPSGWDAVSQGRRALHDRETDVTVVRWESPEPQEEAFVVAGKYTEYSRRFGNIDAMVFLRTPDKSLAEKYIDATIRYITMYEELIGPYPYAKFALVENFWETGFGMPSFTLLGSKIIRFPFIITSSYPHEILHNWWGNSVFPDYSTGNWSEGLTAYLADHLLKEQQGGGAEYRQTTLQKYVDYVSGGRDFPLTEFRSRHGSSSEAIGYGKSLMFFHMLRRELGDRTFVLGLKDFYKKNKFRIASFEDLRRSFEAVSGKDLRRLFHQWVDRTGAPQLRLGDVRALKRGNGFALTAELKQIQKREAYILRIPVAVTMEGHDKAFQTDAIMRERRLELNLRLPSRPLRIDVDPEFDVFRRLDREEIPPAISQALGEKKMLIVLPSSARAELLREYRDLASMLGNSGPDEVEIRLDREVKRIPTDRAVTVLGWENRFMKDVVSALSGYKVSVDRKSVRIGKTVMPLKNHSFVLTARNPENRGVAIMFVAGPPGALPGLGRKLPHYHKYSYLAFEGDEPANVAKGRWPVTGSPMTAFIPYGGKVSRVEMGTLAARKPLISLPAAFSKERMMETARFLSDPGLQGRGLGTAGLDRAADFIARKFDEAGLKPGGDGDAGFFQTWEEVVDRAGDGPGRRMVFKNVIGVIPGKKRELAGQSIVVGAHYDHLGTGWPDVRGDNRGRIHPGADDNASGVSVLVELAAALAGTDPDRSIVFVAFTGEEAGKRGSRHYVAEEKTYPADRCIGMLNLDTVGRLEKRKLLALGADSAGEWVHILRGAGFVTGVDIETVSDKLDSSDQVSFEDAGVPALQLFSGPHPDYHRPGDVYDKIDGEGLVKVASVSKEIIEYLSSTDGRLTAVRTAGNPAAGTKAVRKVSLGTIPDFGFKGRGYRLSGVMGGSPAEAAGMKEGDVIVSLNSKAVRGLKDFSNILKTLTPGHRVSIDFLRSGKEMSVETEVREK